MADDDLDDELGDLMSSRFEGGAESDEEPASGRESTGGPVDVQEEPPEPTRQQGGPSFDYEDAEMIGLYVRPETKADFEQLRKEIDIELYRNEDVDDLEKREIDDAALRVVDSLVDELIDAIVDAREE